MDEEGLAGLSLRDLARRAGITTPTVYAYFESKNAIYDAMFGQAATEFAERMAEPIDGDDPRDVLAAYARRFVEFCTGYPARYQLLFQRTLPGFEPSPESYAPAIRPWPTPGSCWPPTGSPSAPYRPVDCTDHGPGRPAGLQ